MMVTGERAGKTASIWREDIPDIDAKPPELIREAWRRLTPCWPWWTMLSIAPGERQRARSIVAGDGTLLAHAKRQPVIRRATGAPFMKLEGRLQER